MILDTNALSAFVDGDPKVAEALPPGRLAIPVIVLGEFRFGVQQSRRREGYMDWLAENLSDYDVLDVTDRTTTYYAEIRMESRQAGSPIPSMTSGSPRCAASTVCRFLAGTGISTS